MDECSVLVQFGRYMGYLWIEAEGWHALKQSDVVHTAKSIKEDEDRISVLIVNSD